MIQNDVLEVEAEVEENVERAVKNEAGISTTTTPIMKYEKAQLEDKEKINHDRGAANPKYNDIIVKSLGIIVV